MIWRHEKELENMREEFEIQLSSKVKESTELMNLRKI